MAICGILGKYSKTERTLFEISKLRVLRPNCTLTLKCTCDEETYVMKGHLLVVPLSQVFLQIGNFV